MNIKRAIPKTKQEALSESMRFYANAKETLKKSSIEYKIYKDSKYVRESSGMAYLAALKAIDGYLLGIGVDHAKLPKSIQGYEAAINKIPKNGKLRSYLNIVYENLHILAYYRGGVSVEMVKEGFARTKDIINMLS